MPTFTQIAIPHDDIIQGRLTMDVYAADLSQVVSKTAPLDYVDESLFFKKTYCTRGLKNILNIAEDRLKGKSGDAVIQLQTPFGGGKTHTLISLYHKAKQWNANVVVFDGVSFSPKQSKPWEEIERQLIGRIESTKGNVAPGSKCLIDILSKKAPVLILMDEVLEYITKAAAIKVGDSNLASQTFAFIQELTSAVSTVGNALLVMTLPSSMLEHYDEHSEKMYQQLQKITGRVEKIYTPVEDEEIEHVIRKRLFSKIDENGSKEIVDKFIEHITTEGLMSQEEALLYRERFLKSYPFKPEVIDALYKKWGTFSTFQRTRGVLRLLSLVVKSLLHSNIPFIRLGDFDLSHEAIRRELVKHIGVEWDGIIAQDITGDDAGSKRIDNNLSVAYKPFKLGTVVSTTIFMNSFSGKGTTESSIKEIKLSALYPEIHASEIDNVVNQIKERLFYISDEGLYFTNHPNLNRIIITREESIDHQTLFEEEKIILKKHLSGEFGLKIYLYPQFSKDINDNAELKLVVINEDTPNIDFLNTYGEQPRIYRNTLFFLCKKRDAYDSFLLYLRRLLTLESIDGDEKANLTEAQKNEVKSKLKNIRIVEYEEIRKLYRVVFLPAKNGFKEVDLGISTYGEKFIDKEVYEYLKNGGEILESVSPKVIKEKYLQDKEFIEIKKLYNAFLSTPGEIRLVSKQKIIESIKEGVKNRLFGIGVLKDNELIENMEIEKFNNIEDGFVITSEVEDMRRDNISSTNEKAATKKSDENNDNNKELEDKDEIEAFKKFSKMKLVLDVPSQNISTISKVANFLKTKFNNISIKIEIDMDKGEIAENEYENGVLEAFFQSGIKIEKEEKN